MSKLKQKMDEFNKRFAIVDNASYEKEFKDFKTRVLNIFKDIDSYVSKESIAKFCRVLGIKEEWQQHGFGPAFSKNIIIALIGENNEKLFYKLIELILYLDIKTEYDESPGAGNRKIYSRDILYDNLKEALEFSKINLAITKTNDEVILYPQGEKLFDQKLVDEVLSFLDEKSLKHFVEALSFYQKGKQHNLVKSAESLRRSLEEFVRFKLKNKTGLDKNIQELQKKLKKSERDSQVRNIIFSTFSYLDQYFNENSKHQDGDIDEPENEFLIYQTGILMRYININIK